MNKKTALEIASIIFGFYCFLSFCLSLSSLGAAISMNEIAYISRNSNIFWTAASTLILFILAYIFIFKNRLIIAFILSKDDVRDEITKENKSICATSSFWIQMLGLYLFISSFSNLLSQIPIVWSHKSEYVSNTFWWYQTGPHLITLVISIMLVWKSKAIETVITKRKG